MLNLDQDEILEMPVDQLGLLVLEDLERTGEWNEYNYVLGASRAYPDHVARAIAEAMTWLRARALIATTPGQTSSSAIFVTRTGERALAEGLIFQRASERLQGGLHPAIEAVARPQFLIGEYEQGVFVAMKAVEVRVRSLAGFGDDDYGVALMHKAFNSKGGPLTDAGAPSGEQDGTRALFAGAYAVLRNPAGHREVDYEDVAEAVEAVHTASLLMRILDRVASR